MMPANLAAPIWVNTPEKLQKAVADLNSQPAIAVDTESNSLYAYQERVCLIQFSTPVKDYLIDPLAIQDLSSLAPLFANPAQEKIFHASEYDLICLKRDFQFTFKNLFDTMIAARILGVSQFGLAPLLELKLAIKIDKHFQRANWGVRPLSASMLDYARLDSHYLFQLRDLLKKELEEKNLLALAMEDFSLACTVKVPANGDKSQNCWKVARSTPLDPQQAALMQELCHFREEQARKLNLPPFKVLSNELLLALCLEPPASEDELKQVRGMTERIFRQYGAGLQAALKRGLENPPLRREPRIRPEETFLNRLDALKDWRKQKGKDLSVESDVVLPREIMEQIAERNPTTLGELETIMQVVPWRFAHFGDDILSVLRKVEES